MGLSDDETDPCDVRPRSAGAGDVRLTLASERTHEEIGPTMLGSDRTHEQIGGIRISV